MTKIHIPPAALEAGKLAYERYMMDIATEEAISAAFVAMVEAWPGMTHSQPMMLTFSDASKSNLILPLTEKQDDKA